MSCLVDALADSLGDALADHITGAEIAALRLRARHPARAPGDARPGPAPPDSLARVLRRWRDDPALSLDAPVGVEEILAAFGDEQYWQARLAAFDGGTATLNGLTVGDDGSVTAALTVSLFADRLPKVVAALTPGDLEMARTETWHPTGDGQARGAIEVAVPGAPVSAIGKVMLISLAIGARLRLQHHRASEHPAGGRSGRKLHRQPTRRRDQRGAALHQRLDRGAPLTPPCVVDGVAGDARR